MVLHDEQYEAYIQILKEELIPHLGVQSRLHLLTQLRLPDRSLGRIPHR